MRLPDRVASGARWARAAAPVRALQILWPMGQGPDSRDAAKSGSFAPIRPETETAPMELCGPDPFFAGDSSAERPVVHGRAGAAKAAFSVIPGFGQKLLETLDIRRDREYLLGRDWR